jgi:hypothetical protein
MAFVTAHEVQLTAKPQSPDFDTAIATFINDLQQDDLTAISISRIKVITKAQSKMYFSKGLL